MRRRHSRLGVLFASAAIGAPGAEITVQVYNAAHAPMAEVRRATESAGEILRQAGITALWVQCGDPALDMRIVPECYPRRDAGAFVFSILQVDPRQAVSEDVLGFAVLAGRRNGGAAVYPRIVSFLRDNPEYADCDILASVIAHELGHLMLGSPEHGAGIMKGSWGADDFKAMKQRRLRFSPAQRRKLRALQAGQSDSRPL